MMNLSLFTFLKSAFYQRSLIYSMAIRDFQSRYIDTFGGMIWAIVQPLSIVLVYYFVFSVGMRVKSGTDAPFILWFVAGLAPWFLFNDALMAVVNSVTTNAHLIKKMVFPSEVLCFINIVSALIPHIIFMLAVWIMMFFFHVPFSLKRLLFLYYTIALIVLTCGLGWLLSALQVFFRDVGQGMTIVLNVWFWASAIVWPETMVPARFHWVLSINPIYYIIDGYRNCLIHDQVSLPGWHLTLYFWCFTLVVVGLGAAIFNRLKPEFADVL